MTLLLKRLPSAVTLALLTAPQAHAADLSGELAVVTDYRYRGLSLSGGKPAVQGTFDMDFGDGPYVELWASTIQDEAKIRSELDATLGKELELGPSVSLEFDATYYAYPDAFQDNYAEATAQLSKTLGPLMGKWGVSFAPAQRALQADDGHAHSNVYYFTGAELHIPRHPLTLSAQLGYERGPFDGMVHGGKWDWTLSAETQVRSLCLSISYVDSSVNSGKLVGAISMKF